MADEFIDNLVALPDVYHSFSFPVDISLLDTFRCDPDAPPLPEAEGFLHVPEDAFFDAADGELSSSPIAAGEVNSALRTPVSFDDDGVATSRSWSPRARIWAPPGLPWLPIPTRDTSLLRRKKR